MNYAAELEFDEKYFNDLMNEIMEGEYPITCSATKIPNTILYRMEAVCVVDHISSYEFFLEIKRAIEKVNPDLVSVRFFEEYMWSDESLVKDL